MTWLWIAVALAYAALAVQAFRWLIRCDYVEYPSLDIDGAGVAFMAAFACLWPIAVPVVWLDTEREPRDLSRLKRFCGINASHDERRARARRERYGDLFDDGPMF